jgi:quinoprotein glucose dehydrogenase
VKHSFASICFFVPLLACAADRPFDTWRQYLGGADSSQYSSLRQINKTNVNQLEVVWTYPAGPGTLVFDPIVVDASRASVTMGGRICV